MSEDMTALAAATSDVTVTVDGLGDAASGLGGGAAGGVFQLTDEMRSLGAASEGALNGIAEKGIALGASYRGGAWEPRSRIRIL